MLPRSAPPPRQSRPGESAPQPEAALGKKQLAIGDWQLARTPPRRTSIAFIRVHPRLTDFSGGSDSSARYSHVRMLRRADVPAFPVPVAAHRFELSRVVPDDIHKNHI